MKRRHIATGAVALTTAAAMAGTGASMAHAAGSSDNNVRLSNSGRTALSQTGHVRTLGVAPAGQSLELSIAVPLRNQALMNSMLAKGTVISPAEYKRLFGATPASLKRVADWAASRGLRVTASDAATGSVTVSAPIRTVNKAFSLKMQRVALGTRVGVAPNADPQLPKKLGVTSVVGLSTVTDRHTGPLRSAGAPSFPLTAAKRTTARTKTPGASSRPLPGGRTTNATSNACANYWGEHLAVSAKKFKSESNMMCGYTPQQAVAMYHAGSAAKVKSRVGVLLWCDDKKAKAKADAISKAYKYPTIGSYVDESAKENTSDGCDAETAQDVYGEQNMDVQSSHYMSPSASITYYGASGNSDAALISMIKKAVGQHKVDTISMSFSQAEGDTSFQNQFNRLAAQASLTGMSLFGSSGDMGDESIQEKGTKPTEPKSVAFPASSPYVTAVGGTAAALKSTTGTARAFTIGWSTTLYSQPKKDSTTGIKQYPYFGNSVGAGGGVSKVFAQPSWQKGKVTGSTSKRTVPDVSAIADPATGLSLTFDGKTATTSGGTSQSSPMVASMVASAKVANKRKIGNAAPYFYKLKGTSGLSDVKAVAKGYYGMVFGQVASGDYILEGMATPSDSLRVTSGWDDVTGLGEPGSTFMANFGK